MEKIILVRPSTDKNQQLRFDGCPPLGILSIASSLKSQTFNVEILDQTVDINFAQKLTDGINKKPLCVAISSITGFQLKNALNCAKIVKKKNKNIPVILGGVHASIFPQQVAESEYFDIVVQGEGELIMLKLAEALSSKREICDIEGIAFKHAGKVHINQKGNFVDLNALPNVDYTLIDIEKYIHKSHHFGGDLRTFAINTGRGCCFSCKFCYNTFMGKGYRHLPAQKIIETIKILNRDFNIKGFIFIDDYFFADKEFVKSVCNCLIDNNLNIVWHGNARVNTFLQYDRSMLDLLKQSGCNSLTFGIESGSQRMLDFVNKKISVKQIKLLKHILQREGFNAYLSFLFGLPTENREDFINTLKIIDYLYSDRKKVILEINSYLPYPGTELYDFVVEQNLFDPPSTIEEWASLEWDSCHVSNFSRMYGELLCSVRILFLRLKNRSFKGRITYWFFYNLYILLKWDLILFVLNKLISAFDNISSHKRK